MNPYIQSLRLRTLPLSMSGIVLGSGLAYSHLLPLSSYLLTFSFAILTTLSLQILSNLSNELGDALKGTDTDQHGRQAYGLQAGTITIPQMKKMIILFIVLSILFGLTLLYIAFGLPISNIKCHMSNILIFLGLGLLAIVGAMTYTLGKHSYGYMGLGDLGVFLFFGLLSTVGAYYLQTKSLNVEVFCLGAAIGLPCVGVLNLNNIRDMVNDRKHGKRTLASTLGMTGAKIYHTCLLVTCLTLFGVFGHWWAFCIAPVWIWHLYYVWTHQEAALDQQMPVLMFTTLIVACLGWL